MNTRSLSVFSWKVLMGVFLLGVGFAHSPSVLAAAKAKPATAEEKALLKVLAASAKKKKLGVTAAFCAGANKNSGIVSVGVTGIKQLKKPKTVKLMGSSHLHHRLQVQGWCQGRNKPKDKLLKSSFRAEGDFYTYKAKNLLQLRKVVWDKKRLVVTSKTDKKLATKPVKKVLGRAAQASELAAKKKPTATKKKPPGPDVPLSRIDAELKKAGKILQWQMQEKQNWLGRLALTLVQDYSFRRAVSDADERVLPVASAEFAARLSVDDFLLVTDQGRALVHVQRNPSFKGDPFIRGRLQPGQKLPGDMVAPKRALVLQKRQSNVKIENNKTVLVRVAEPMPGPIFSGVLSIADRLKGDMSSEIKDIFGVEIAFWNKVALVGGNLGAKEKNLVLSSLKKTKRKNGLPWTIKAKSGDLRVLKIAIDSGVEAILVTEE